MTLVSGRSILKVWVVALVVAAGLPAFAGDIAPFATTQPTAKPREGYRLLGAGSWVVTHSAVTSSMGFPSNVKRKVVIAADGTTGGRTLSESRWSGAEFEPTGPAQSLGPIDGRTFDQMGFTPQTTLPDAAIHLSRRRYLCSVNQYLFRSESDGRSVLLTLYRDKSQTIKLPARSLIVGGREIPLPADAIQAEFTVEGPRMSAKGSRRIIAMASPLIVSGKTCICLVESTRTEGTSNDKPLSIQSQEWFSDALPGERMRMQTITTVGKTRVDSDVTVVEFGVTPAEAKVAGK